MHAISLFVCWWFANGTLLHAFCTFSFWTKSKPLNWNRRREKKYERCIWAVLNKMVHVVRAHSLWAGERQRKRGAWKPTVPFFFSLPLFFFYCEVYLSAAPLQCSQSSLTTEDMFSLCEIQSLWYAGKLLFSTPNCCLWEASVKNSVSKVNLIKVAKWKVHALIFPSLGCVWEFEICSCDSGSQFFSFFFSFSLYFEVRTCKMYATLDTKKADGFLSWIGLLLNYIGTLSCEVYSLITILLKNTGVILGSYKMEDGVKNTFVS